MVRSRAHTVIEVIVAYALFAGLIVAAAPDPRPALHELRASFEYEVARGLVEGELVRAESSAHAGVAPLAADALDVAGWPAAGQLEQLRLARAVEAVDGGYTVQVSATWVAAGGEPRELSLDTWLRTSGEVR